MGRSMKPAVPRSLYRVSFLNQGKIYEVFVRQVNDQGLWGFVSLEDFVFGQKTERVIDPSEERLRDEFSGVRRALIPLHAIFRIDEVSEEGTARIIASEGSNVTPLPFVYPAGREPKK